MRVVGVTIPAASFRERVIAARIHAANDSKTEILLRMAARGKSPVATRRIDNVVLAIDTMVGRVTFRQRDGNDLQKICHVVVVTDVDACAVCGGLDHGCRDNTGGSGRCVRGDTESQSNVNNFLDVVFRLE